MVDSISDSEEPESISSSISDANTDTSLLQENNQGIRGSSPLPSNAKESQCGSHTFELKRTTMLQDLSRKENLTDRLHCNCKQCSLVNGNLHTTDRTSGLQHTCCFSRASLLINESVSLQASSSKAIDRSCLPYRQSRSHLLAGDPCDLTPERRPRLFRTSLDFTSSCFHHAKTCLLDPDLRERLSHSLRRFRQRSLTAPRHSRYPKSLDSSDDPQHTDTSQIGTLISRVDPRLQPSHSAAHYVGKELDFPRRSMEDYSRKPGEVNGHRRVQTHPSVQNNNTEDGMCVVGGTIVPVASDEHKILEHAEQGPNPGPPSAQGESVGDIFKRRMKDHRRLRRWKAWFEAQQIFINTTGQQFAAENRGQGPVLVPEPAWLHRQAALMGQEAVRIAQQVPYMEQQPGFGAQTVLTPDTPQHDSQVAGTNKNRMSVLEEALDGTDPPLLASSKQSLAEYLIFKKRPCSSRRNSEPIDIKSILHLTAFENSAAFRDYINATTAELDDPFAQDDATDFGLLALRDRPVAEWGRE